MNSWETVLDYRCELGEGPVWDSVRNRLLWVDILPGHIHSFHPQTGEHRRFEVGQMVGAVALRPDGNLVAALQHGFYEISLDGGILRPIADPEAHLPNNRFNDGKCDPAGRFWAGTMSLFDEPGAGSLYVLDTDNTVSRQESHVSCSNGLAWSHDHSQMYYIDSPTRQVVVYDYDLASGSITNKRVAIYIDEREGMPDGMTIDPAGMLWVALWDGWQVIRYDPRSGKLVQRVRLPAARITSCTFGGPTGGDLYITSARTGLSPDALAGQPLAGRLFVVENVGSG